MAGTATPASVTEYVAKASPVLPLTLNDDNGNPVNIAGATLSGYILNQNLQTVAKMYGTFAITNAAAGQATYQWTLIDVNVPGFFYVYVSAKLPSEPYQREFNPIFLYVAVTPEYIGGTYVQEVDLNVAGQPNTSTNPTYTDITDRMARLLGHVILDSMPAITGAVAPQVNSANVSTSNPLPTTSGQVGQVAAYGSNPGSTGIATDAQFKFGASGTTTVQRVIISNETGADVRYELDATATANSLRLKDGNVLFIQQPCTVVHLYTAASQSINVAGGVMVRGYN